jgi:Cu-Zn family superoxide dismutase
MRYFAPILCASALSLAACAENEPVDPNADANIDLPAIDAANSAANSAGPASATITADFMGDDQAKRGTVTAADSPAGLTLTLAASNLLVGQHGIHLHMTGKCEPPKFESAGAHLNPTDRKHGTENPDGPHQGDLPNVEVASSGRLNTVLNVPGLTMEQMRDADGTALVIHAKADDNRTDPSGESGDRIACAVIAPAQ